MNRAFLAPQLSVTHRSEAQFENLEVTAQLGWSITRDSSGLGWTYFVGPVLELSKTLRGWGAAETQLLSLEGRIGLKSHDFELYAEHPQAGYRLDFMIDLSHRSIFSGQTTQRYFLSGEWLWNLFGFEPPLWVIGVRGAAATVFVPRLSNSLPDLPANLLQYLGGSRDLRGFGRLEISENGKGGGLSSLYLGVEARLGGVIPYGVDPFVFFDFGRLGSQSLALDSPYYWAPGLGLRWASPVGALRVTVAHGFGDWVARHWQIYFSLGEEF